MKNSPPQIRILIADDHKMVRAGLAAILETERDFVIVGQAGNGKEAVAEALRLKPDVILMDLMMPVMDGVQATGEIHVKLPDVRILVVTTYGSSDGLAHALRNGAAGVLMKSADGEELAAAIRCVFAGKEVIPEEIKRQLRIDPPVSELTPRQKEILDSLTRGLSNSEIASQLGICQDRVKEHINTILTKIGAGNRTEAVAIALRRQLLKI